MAKLDGPTGVSMEGHISSGLLEWQREESCIESYFGPSKSLGPSTRGSDLLRKTLSLSTFCQ